MNGNTWLHSCGDDQRIHIERNLRQRHDGREHRISTGKRFQCFRFARYATSSGNLFTVTSVAAGSTANYPITLSNDR